MEALLKLFTAIPAAMQQLKCRTCQRPFPLLISVRLTSLLVQRWVDVLSLAEQHAVNGFESVQQGVNARNTRNNHRCGTVAYNQVEMVLSCNKSGGLFAELS